jgi:Holliday junction DNA helicase RuvA
VIASLTGTVQAKAAGSIVLDVAGVGYQVWVPSGLLNSLKTGSSQLLHTALIVREDAFVLFGFEDPEQLALFDLLRSVSGVGPKTALSIISSLSGADIAYAVGNDDSKPFEKVSGVGVKTAKLITVTLAGKLKSFDAGVRASNQDLLLALQGLGWPERVAEPIVNEVLKGAGSKSMSELIRECLALLGGNK